MALQPRSREHSAHFESLPSFKFKAGALENGPLSWFVYSAPSDFKHVWYTNTIEQAKISQDLGIWTGINVILAALFLRILGSTFYKPCFETCIFCGRLRSFLSNKAPILRGRRPSYHSQLESQGLCFKLRWRTVLEVSKQEKEYTICMLLGRQLS